MTSIDLLIYDLDGTLIDSGKDIANAVNFMLKELGLKERPLAEIKGFIGDGVTNLVKRALFTVSSRGEMLSSPRKRGSTDMDPPVPPGLSARRTRGKPGDDISLCGDDKSSRDDEKLLKKGLNILKKYYWDHALDHTKAYPGVKEVLTHFKNKHQVIITNKPTKYSVKILKGLHLDTFFKAVIGGDDTRTKKPSPESTLQVMKEMNVGPRRTVIIGDSALDVETGKNAHIRTCGVTYGFGNLEKLEKSQPDHLLHRLSELKSLFV